jgi:hypothetical protein
MYPRGFSAPEAICVDGLLDVRSDLYSWAAVVVYLLSDSVSMTAFEATNRREFGAALERLAEAAPNTLRAMSPRTDRRPLKKVVAGWSAAVDCSLADDPRARPSSVDALRRIVMPRTPFGALLRFFQASGRR